MRSIEARRRGGLALALLGAILALVPAAAHAAPGEIRGSLPAADGVGAVVWGGGSVDTLAVAARAQGCDARSAWVFPSGRPAGYIVGAPAFVNAAFTALFPGAELPADTIVVVRCLATPVAGPPPAGSPAPSSGASPAPSPTPSPTASPMPSPTPSPTPAPTASATPAPTPSPTASTAHFQTLPVGATLPSGAACAALVRSAPAVRPDNATANATRGTAPNTEFPRVTGDFTGTTDELIQWAACKWGIDEDIVRAQVAIESWWHQSAAGDLTSDQSLCYPEVRTATGQCPESVGLMQVRYPYHGSAFVDGNALHSSAYNLDYAYAVWRACYEGHDTWLNSAPHVGQYAAGDAWGCVGVWFAGRWHTPAADAYIQRVRDALDQRVWETASFLAG